MDLKQSLKQSIANASRDDVEYAKIVARRMFEMYDKDKNRNIDNYEVSPMIEDAYKSFNKTYNPTNDDINCYAKILDQNHDGKVSLADIEALCIKYLVGEHALALNNTNSYVNTAYTTPYKSAEETAKRTTSPPYLEASNYSPSPYAIRDSSPVVYRNSGSRVFDSSGSPLKRAESRIASDYVFSSPYKRAESRVADYGLAGSRVAEYGLAGSPYRRQETEKRASASIVIDPTDKNSVYLQKGKIEQIKRVFDKYDTNKDGFIDELELKRLMEETYKFLGIAKVITSSDVQSYLDMVDTNKDGRISYPEYETIVVKCLAKINIRFN